MIVKRLLTPQQPFADDTSGFGYFATDLHYQRLAANICQRVASSSGIILVTGEPPPDGELLLACLNDEEALAGYRASLVACRPDAGFDDLVRSYSEQLGLSADDEGGSLWPLISHLMLESRKGVTRLLIVDGADALDDQAFDELHRFARVDDPHLLPVLLLASDDFNKRINAPPLSFLKPAIVAQLSLQRLEAEEVAAFIHYQLNAAEGAEVDAFPAETVEAIAAAAEGDPSIVNCLAREALAFRRRRTTTTLAAVPPLPPAPPAEPAAEPAAYLQADASPEREPEHVAEEPAPLEEAPESEPVFKPVDAAAQEAAEKTTLIELAAMARRSSESEPEPEIAAAAPPAPVPNVAPVADATMDLKPAATMAAKLNELAAAGSRHARTGLAAIAYLLIAAVSGGALLYLILPGASDRVPSNVTAEATVPQAAPADDTPVATPASAVTESPATLPSDGAASASAEPSTSPPPLPPESAMMSAKAAPLAPKADPAATRRPSSLLAAAPSGEAATAEPLPAPPPAAVEKLAIAEVPASTEKVIPAEPPPPAAAKVSSESPPVTEKIAPAEPAAAKLVAEPVPPAAERLAMVEPSSPSPAIAPARDAAPEPPSVAPIAAIPPAAAPGNSAPVAVPAVSAPAPAAPAASTPVPSPAPQVAALEPSPSAASPSRSADRPPPAEIAVLLKRGDQLLAAGDIVSARRFFELAAASGDPAASLGLGKSYDPLFLQQTGARGVSGKPADAAKWYRKAVEAGNSEASTRLNRLLARYPQ